MTDYEKTVEDYKLFLKDNWEELADEGATVDGWAYVADSIVDTRRGAPVHKFVVKNPDGELWQFTVLEYDEGWEFYPYGHGFCRVEAKEVTTITYVPVNNG